MSTIREQILAAIKTALTGTTGVDVRIYRSRPEAISRGESPAILIEPVGNSPVQPVIGFLDNVFTVRISVIARGAVPDQVADPTIASLHAKIMADLTLGGLAMDIQPGATNYLIEEGDQPAAVISCDYNVIHRTSLTDLTTGN
ncbi:MAG: hypothetical protein SFX19_10135 [Alphaproteobacteria bacterium]|nr:hypothetical protein [Alphaproteobacteria bacterium]